MSGKRRARSTGARLVGAAMLAVHEVFYGPQEDEIVAVADSSGDPPSDDAIDVQLGDDPRSSRIVVRRKY